MSQEIIDQLKYELQFKNPDVHDPICEIFGWEVDQELIELEMEFLDQEYWERNLFLALIVLEYFDV